MVANVGIREATLLGTEEIINNTDRNKAIKKYNVLVI